MPLCQSGRWLPNIFTPALFVLGLLFSTTAIAQQPANRWTPIAGSETARRTGAVLLWAEDLNQRLLLGGQAEQRGHLLTMTPGAEGWTAGAAEPAIRGGFHPYYQAVYDPAASRIYCCFQGTIYTLDLKPNGDEPANWEDRGAPAALAGLSWTTMAIDPQGRRLVVVGADKRAENLGWTRTAILQLDTGRWSTLPPPAAEVVAEHQALVAAREATIDLVGNLRLAWYRDPQGTGSDAHRQKILQQLKQRPALARFATQLEQLAGQVTAAKLLPALRLARDLEREIEILSEQQYPAPTSRRNAPLAWDAGNQVFVLFGGDHEDYQMNDTWILDLKQSAWRRAQPKLAPSPRAGHALVYLPKHQRLAMYEGYTAASNPDYRSGISASIRPRQLWTFDVRQERWDLLQVWEDAAKGEPPAEPYPATSGQFYGYSGQWFHPPALVVEEGDRLILHTATGKETAGAWSLRLDPQPLPPALQEKWGMPPQSRHYRTGQFVAAYGETDEPAPETKLDQLTVNRWQALPPAPKNMTRGCRQRDWSTSMWDADNDQILLWGGGHVVRSASTVIHYSPVSGRMVEGYDADEPYGYNGGGGYGSSLWNRPWVPTHGYNLYAYDPRAKLLVTATGAFYDPQRMDWLRAEPQPRPFQFHWASTVLETTPHGVVAWAKAIDGNRIGLWLYDREAGWQDLKPQGKLFQPYCDSDGIVYDARRDRLLLSWGGGYGKRGEGSLTSYDFATHKVEKITPVNAELGELGGARELVYVAHDDCILFGSEAKRLPDGAADEQGTLVYDCAENRYRLLDAGPVPYGHSAGWMYDAKRKLVYVFTHRGEAYALNLRLDQAAPTAKEPAGG